MKDENLSPQRHREKLKAISVGANDSGVGLVLLTTGD
jgi:hypothetical protein